MMLAAAELRRHLRDRSRNTQLTARKLADFVASIEVEESLLLQRLRNAETKQVNQIVDGCRVEPQSGLGPIAGELDCPLGQTVKSQPSVQFQPAIFEEY